MGIPFDCPADVIDLLGGVKRMQSDVPASKRQRHIQRCESHAEKLDEVSLWKQWTDQVGIRLKGMRALVSCYRSLSRPSKLFYDSEVLRINCVMFQGVLEMFGIAPS